MENSIACYQQHFSHLSRPRYGHLRRDDWEKWCFAHSRLHPIVPPLHLFAVLFSTKHGLRHHYLTKINKMIMLNLCHFESDNPLDFENFLAIAQARSHIWGEHPPDPPLQKPANQEPVEGKKTGATTRNPTLLLESTGLPPPRPATRAIRRVLYHEPPRKAKLSRASPA